MPPSRLADYLLENPLYGYGRQVGAAGSATTPVQSPMEGLARALQGGVGGFFEGQGLRQAKGEQTADQTALAQAMEMYGKDPAAARALLASRPNLSDQASQLLMQDVGFQRQKDLLDYKQTQDEAARGADMKMFGITPGGAPSAPTGGGSAGAIAGMESGGKYDAIGPVANSQGNRALGKYQVLDSNVGPWTKEILGQEMTPQQFLASPQAQDAVFKGKFGQYAQKYGPEGAARAWFAGEGGMNNPNAKDVNGMTVQQYGQKFLANGGGAEPQVAQGATPQVAPGAPQQPQQALNVPQADTINFQGVQLPKAEVAAAMMIRDPKERQSKLTDIVRESVKSAKGPDAGTNAGDVHILEGVRANPALASDPSYQAAYNRASQPQQSQSGQLLYPDMSAYPKPITDRGQNQTSVRIEDTPTSRFQMSGKLADDMNALQPVKDYKAVAPIFASMQDAVTRNTRVADLNLVYGLAKIMDPASVVREGETVMVKNAQGLPDWLRGSIAAVNGGSAFPAEQRARIMQEAESRVGALKTQYDSIAKQFAERGQRFGLKPEDIITAPAGPAAPAEQGGGAVRKFNPSTGRIE